MDQINKENINDFKNDEYFGCFYDYDFKLHFYIENEKRIYCPDNQSALHYKKWHTVSQIKRTIKDGHIIFN
jgi:hypothetical protein